MSTQYAVAKAPEAEAGIQYSLKLTIDSQSLDTLFISQQRIILAKPVGGGKPNVSWLSLKPFQSTTIEWTESYGLYVSHSEVKNGAEIVQQSTTDYPAQDGAFYSLLPTSNFSGPFTGAGAPPPGSFQVANNMPVTDFPFLTFGLVQKASVNGTEGQANPINAQVVPSLNSAIFTPLTEVQVWLQTSLLSGTVITQVFSSVADVTFGNDVFQKTLQYDPKIGGFVPTSSDPNVRLIEPRM